MRSDPFESLSNKFFNQMLMDLNLTLDGGVMTIPMKYYRVADDRMFIFDELTFQDQSCA